MESVYHIVTIRVNETSWAHVWRLHSRYLGTGYDSMKKKESLLEFLWIPPGSLISPCFYFCSAWRRAPLMCPSHRRR
jgi:hypothetical protein